MVPGNQGHCGPNERDYGQVLPSECPGCRSRALRLVERRSGVPLLRLLGLGGCWQIRCAQCAWAQDIPAREVGGLRRLCVLAADYAAGRLRREDLAEAIANCGLTTVDAILARGAVWTCSACGEEVPASLAACWNCEAPQPPGVAPEPDAEEMADDEPPSRQDPLLGHALYEIRTEREESEAEAGDANRPAPEPGRHPAPDSRSAAKPNPTPRGPR